jgi:hypothetical protein
MEHHTISSLLAVAPDRTLDVIVTHLETVFDAERLVIVLAFKLDGVVYTNCCLVVPEEEADGLMQSLEASRKNGSPTSVRIATPPSDIGCTWPIVQPVKKPAQEGAPV